MHAIAFKIAAHIVGSNTCHLYYAHLKKQNNKKIQPKRVIFIIYTIRLFNSDVLRKKNVKTFVDKNFATKMSFDLKLVLG